MNGKSNCAVVSMQTKTGTARLIGHLLQAFPLVGVFVLNKGVLHALYVRTPKNIVDYLWLVIC